MFELAILFSADRLNLIKAELTSKLPDVKSSHRCEAIARGLGFRTYAAALAAGRTETLAVSQVRGDLFSNYLAQHGFSVSPKTLYHAGAKIALRDVSEREPRLTIWGIGTGQPERKENKRWENTQEMNEKFQKYRAELVSDSAVDPFLASLSLLRRVTSTKTIRRGTGSYWLKHVVENYNCTYPEGEHLGPVYVPNGALIAAALHRGFKIKTHTDYLGYNDVNVSFNMSKPCLENLDSEIRPNGAYA